MSYQLIIHAINVHEGGGAVLLNNLLSSLEGKSIRTLVLADSRLVHRDFNNIDFIKIKPTILARLYAEVLLKSCAKKHSPKKILCFGNLPPIFKLNSSVALFFQNMIYFYRDKERGFSLFQQLKQSIEKKWLKFFIKNVNCIYVQTESVKKSIESYTRHTAITVFPFAKIECPVVQKNLENKSIDFIYIASGSPHKNHENLLEAWRFLLSYNIKPSLKLICKNLSLKNKNTIDELKLMGAKIFDTDYVEHASIAVEYSKARALIFPSILESYGLPLVEAHILGLSILASELDYVRDVVDPDETFDPRSHISIARAVMRFLGVMPEKVITKEPDEFISELLN